MSEHPQFTEPGELDSDETLEPHYNDGGEFGDQSDEAEAIQAADSVTPSDEDLWAKQAEDRWLNERGF